MYDDAEVFFILNVDKFSISLQDIMDMDLCTLGKLMDKVLDFWDSLAKASKK